MIDIIQIIGMIFVGVIMICIGWAIMSYITEAYAPNNKLEENIKKFNKKYNK